MFYDVDYNRIGEIYIWAVTSTVCTCNSVTDVHLRSAIARTCGARSHLSHPTTPVTSFRPACTRRLIPPPAPPQSRSEARGAPFSVEMAPRHEYHS